MFSKVVVKSYVAIVAGVITGGLVSHNLTGEDVLPSIWFALLALGGATMLGSGLRQLASWTGQLPDRGYLTFMCTWIVAWLAAGVVGAGLSKDSVLVNVSLFLAGILMAYSILTIRIWRSIKAEQTNIRPIDGYGPGLKGS